MSDKKYSIGIDYGTLSGRAVLVELTTGNIIATEVKNYEHAVMDEYLPDGVTKLAHDTALQFPQDYIDVIYYTVPSVIKQSGVDPEDIIGLAIDFTACTMLPIDSDGIPLCEYEEYKHNPHAYIKLWKHHAAQKQANILNNIAVDTHQEFIKRYGGKISSEWMIPKIMQILDEAPEIYDRTDMFIEATDWVNFRLTGNIAKNSCTAGYKALWHKKCGYPSGEFFKLLNPKMENITETKLRGKIYPLGELVGHITPEMAAHTGLSVNTAVAVANVDAHVAVPAVGITEAGSMLMNIGTSTCHMILGNTEKTVPGMCGVVEDGIIPGLYGYEAGQSCVGDHFDWFVHNCVPREYELAAESRGIDIHRYLTEKAAELKVGESGLVALDWWNGNRSVLVDVDLTGVIVGMTLLTKPEEIYRALIEATAYGTNMIIETFENNGVPINKLYACGGISRKNAFIMQIYADVTGKEIFISASDQTAALGSAMFGAVAAGKKNGGYDTIEEAAAAMAKVEKHSFKPIPENVEVYKKLYGEYRELHDYFGRGTNDIMKRLKRIKAEASK